MFLPSDLYFAWREGRGESTEAGGLVPSAEAVGDVKKAKLCPQDGRIMSRHKVGADESFWLDRCATCGGLWFDGEEWTATAEAGLLGSLPAIVSDAWQRDIEEAQAREYRREKLVERLGAEDLDRVDTFRSWLWEHEDRHFILARLRESPEAEAEKPRS